MKKRSAGLLVYRMKNGRLEVLIVHPGGPFFAKKDDGIWTIPKGLYDNGENALDAAAREFEEEVGVPAPKGTYIELGEIKRKDGKHIKAWALEGDIDEKNINSNTFELEWPPRSGKMREFPEVDRAQWLDLGSAAKKLQSAQVEFLHRLASKLGVDFDSAQSKASPKQNSLF